jgi:hypothetical protein
MLRSHLLRTLYKASTLATAVVVGMSFGTSSAMAATTLSADGPGETYELIESKNFGIESPDCGHAVRHIREVQDATLNKPVFAFDSHRDLDDDRCGATDRQRIEIKTSPPGSAELEAGNGQTAYYRWKFKLPTGFQPSNSFTHIFQIKANAGGDEGSPLLTFTPRAGSPNVMQIIFNPSTGGSGAGVKAQTSLAPFINTWVEAFVQYRSSDSGNVTVTLKRLSDGQTLLSWTSGTVDMWRGGADFNRGKWGIYRSLDNASQLRDETVLFADWCITETSAADCPSSIGTIPPPDPVGPPGYTFCAREAGVCSFTGAASVAYGANGLFNFLQASGSIACNSATFGDPAPGVAKACFFQPLSSGGFEAERGVLSGTARILNKAIFSGGQGIGFIGGATANWVRLDNINATTAGNYTMTIHYASGTARTLFWSVNAGTAASASLNSGSFETLATHKATVVLRAGANSIRFFNNTANAPDVDRITLEFVPTPVEVTPAVSAITASSNDGNVPGNTVDNNLSTRWSANGDGQWIRFDLGTARMLTHVRIAFYQGNTRASRFDLQLSDDGVTWRNAFTSTRQSSGTTLSEETFNFDDQSARYVRYLGHGNTSNTWNSLTEVSIFAMP